MQPDSNRAVPERVNARDRVQQTRILVVDDNQATYEMVITLFGFAGYEVSRALNVAEGLRAAKKERLDLILLNWNFEDGTGLELCQMIRTFDRDTPILFYAGVADEPEIKKAMMAGAQGCLFKPVGMESVLQTVKRLVRDDSREAPAVT